MSFAGLVMAGLLASSEPAFQPSSSSGARLNVLLGCSNSDCFEDYLREEVEIVEYVRDRADGDVHVLVTSAETVCKGREYTLAFIGQGRFDASGGRCVPPTSKVIPRIRFAARYKAR